MKDLWVGEVILGYFQGIFRFLGNFEKMRFKKHDNLGCMATRTWARQDGTNSLVTTYSYSDSGDLIEIDYSDSTPDVSFTYDRLGRQKTAESSVSSHSFAYNSNLQLESETLTINHEPSTITNIIVRSYDGYGSPSGFTFNPSDSSYSVLYSYDSFGRFSSVSSSVQSASSAVNYSYLPNSDLIQQMTINDALQMTRTYESNRNLITQIKNEFDSEVISQYDYINDNGGRRTSVKHSGTAFLAPAFNKYDYNNRSEVTSGNRYWGSDIGDTGNPVAGQAYGYEYDNIGNRITATRNGSEASYSANSLNQYTQQTVPDEFAVIGSATTQAIVTVNSEPVTRQNAYWYKQLTATNSAEAAYPLINVTGVARNAGTNGQDVVTTETGHVFVAKTPETFTYDDDGNLLSDGRWVYTWNAENRLIQMETSTNLPASVPAQLLSFAYDYQGRRTQKTVYNWDSSTNDWQLTTDTWFVYDGWNLIQSMTINDAEQMTNTDSYVHGLDLSGSLQGAGGIGGLLACHWSSTSNPVLFFTFDGNGNVSELISTNGSISAHYEYDPYGNTIVVTGPLAKENKFRFSTKYLDRETLLYYYGYRYYSPSLGRWLSKDSLADIGSIAWLNTRKNTLLFLSALNQEITRQLNDPAISENERQQLLDLSVVLSELDKLISVNDPILMTELIGVNWYLFSANNPVNFIDPFGLFLGFSVPVHQMKPGTGIVIVGGLGIALGAQIGSPHLMIGGFVVVLIGGGVTFLDESGSWDRMLDYFAEQLEPAFDYTTDLTIDPAGDSDPAGGDDGGGSGDTTGGDSDDSGSSTAPSETPGHNCVCKP